jgi:hypothetical protein
LHYLCSGFRSPKQLKTKTQNEKSKLFSERPGPGCLRTCNNAAEEAVVEETVDTTVVEEVVTEDTTAVEATEEVAAEGEEAAAE